MKVSIERTSERPVARESGTSRAIVQYTNVERLEIEIAEPFKVYGDGKVAEQQSLQTDRGELKAARRMVGDFLRRSNDRFDADASRNNELAIIEKARPGDFVDHDDDGLAELVDDDDNELDLERD